jgi:hypothetical protein
MGVALCHVEVFFATCVAAMITVCDTVYLLEWDAEEVTKEQTPTALYQY